MTDQCNFKTVVSHCGAEDTFWLIAEGESCCDRTFVIFDQTLHPEIFEFKKIYSTILQQGLSILWQHEKLSLCRGYLTFTALHFIFTLLLPSAAEAVAEQHSWAPARDELAGDRCKFIIRCEQSFYSPLQDQKVEISHRRFRDTEFT